MTGHAIYLKMIGVTKARLGRAINLHLFRDCLTTSIAIRDPEHVRMSTSWSGHLSPELTESLQSSADARGQSTVSAALGATASRTWWRGWPAVPSAPRGVEAEGTAAILTLKSPVVTIGLNLARTSSRCTVWMRPGWRGSGASFAAARYCASSKRYRGAWSAWGTRASSHYWAREIRAFGHEVKLMRRPM